MVWRDLVAVSVGKEDDRVISCGGTRGVIGLAMVPSCVISPSFRPVTSNELEVEAWPRARWAIPTDGGSTGGFISTLLSESESLPLPLPLPVSLPLPLPFCPPSDASVNAFHSASDFQLMGNVSCGNGVFTRPFLLSGVERNSSSLVRYARELQPMQVYLMVVFLLPQLFGSTT